MEDTPTRTTKATQGCLLRVYCDYGHEAISRFELNASHEVDENPLSLAVVRADKQHCPLGNCVMDKVCVDASFVPLLRQQNVSSFVFVVPVPHPFVLWQLARHMITSRKSPLGGMLL